MGNNRQSWQSELENIVREVSGSRVGWRRWMVGNTEHHPTASVIHDDLARGITLWVDEIGQERMKSPPWKCCKFIHAFTETPKPILVLQIDGNIDFRALPLVLELCRRWFHLVLPLEEYSTECNALREWFASD